LVENESTDIEKCPRLRSEGNARLKKVLAWRPGVAKIIEKVCNSIIIERPETVLHMAKNGCCIEYADTWWLKKVH
jgi:hypothetical protein